MVINLKYREDQDGYWTILKSHPRALESINWATQKRRVQRHSEAMVQINRGIPRI